MFFIYLFIHVLLLKCIFLSLLLFFRQVLLVFIKYLKEVVVLEILNDRQAAEIYAYKTDLNTPASLCLTFKVKLIFKMV